MSLCNIRIKQMLESIAYQFVLSGFTLGVFLLLVVHIRVSCMIVWCWISGSSSFRVLFYFTFSFFPARMLLPFMLLSLFSLLTVVPLRRAMSDKVSP